MGLRETRRQQSEAGRFTLVFLGSGAAADAAEVELTYNWDQEPYEGGRNFGHLAYEVDDIYAVCQRLEGQGRGDQPPAARRAHGLRPLARQHLDRASAAGPALATAEPWASRANRGEW